MEIISTKNKNTQNYGNSERVKKLELGFFENFGLHSTDIFSSPGRIEICGNHTDHNHGKVVVGAIDCDTLAVVSKNNNKISIISDGFQDIRISIDDVDYSVKGIPKSYSIVVGVLKGFLDKGYNIGGFNAQMNSTVFLGAGVSSSASFELLICQILNHYYNGGKIPPIELAKIAQFAENIYFGKPCGLLDQCGIALGGICKIDFEDTENPKVERLGAIDGVGIILVNTGNHENLTEHYAKIRVEMTNIAKFFGKDYLRDVSKKDFLDSLPTLKKQFSGREILRAIHFYEENERVDDLAKGIKEKKTKSVLNIINQSGNSSAMLLQNVYVPTDEEQGISLAVNVAKEIEPSVAARVHGGGFAGTAIIFVDKKKLDNLYNKLIEIFGKENVFSASIREYGAAKI